MLMTVIMTIIVAGITATIMLRFRNEEKTSMAKVVLGSVAVGLCVSVLNNYLVPDHSGLAWLFMLICFAFIGALVYQWRRQGSDLIEFLCFTALTLIVGGIASAAAANYKSAFPMLLSAWIPILAIGYYGVIAMRFHAARNTLSDEERTGLLKQKKEEIIAEMDKKAVKFGRYAITIGIITLLVLSGTTGLVLGMSSSGLLGKEQAVTADAADADTGVDEADSKKSSNTSNWHFYNNDVQGGKTDDDFNFGPEPKAETASEYDADFRARLEKDPALGAADIAWADAWLGTRYLGEFYESCNEDWAKTINAAKEAWIKDPDTYKQTLDAFFGMLNTAETKVTAGNGLEDQMYMNPYTVDGTPDVIVLATPDHTGKFLTYYFTIKGTGKVKVMYRVECGYQPTNVEEVMGITPQAKPSNPSTPNSSPTSPKKARGGGEPSKPNKPSNPGTPKYNKDPNKAPKKNTEPNDDSGPGPNTNNPSNPNKSTKDTTDSSSSMTYPEYRNNVDNLKDTNENQKTGSDSNQPSTPAPKPNTNVDNNGDSGNGGAPINTPTPKQEAETVNNDPAAGQMSEPS